MMTIDAESVAGPSHGKSHDVMQMMTSQLHLYPSQHLQPTTVCLPVSVQQLSYEDDEFIDAAAHDGGGPPVMSMNPEAELSYSVSAVTSSQSQPAPSITSVKTSILADFFDSTMVRFSFLIFCGVFAL